MPMLMNEAIEESGYGIKLSFCEHLDRLPKLAKELGGAQGVLVADVH